MSIKVRNLQQVLRRLDKASEQIQRGIDAELTDGANRIEERAKLLAPLDRGRLRSGIVARTDVPFRKTVEVNAFYAPFVEFGTKGKFRDQGQPQVAAQFKGQKRGSFQDFVESMYEYIRRKKGFPADVKTPAAKLNYARIVALKIAKTGIPPANNGTGYFFRAYREILPSIIENCRKIIRNR